jgi:hypothetical protein
MDVRAGTRGQSIQLGAILLFGILVLFAAGYQAFAVPNQNAGFEQDHSERVQDQMQEVRTGIHATAATGSPSPATVQMGVRYPSRTVFLNPTPGAGTLESEEAGDFEISGATAINSETRDFWGGNSKTYSTNKLEYRPNYERRDDPPTTVYESTVLYNRFGQDSLLETDQRLVEGRTVSLVALRGEYQRSTTETISVEPTPVSAPPRTIAVRGQQDGNGGYENITLKVPISDAAIGSELEGTVSDQPNTIDETRYYDANRTLRIVLRGEDDGGEPITYRLQLSSVALGSGTPSSSPAYVTDIEGDNKTIPEGSRQRLTAEIRDEFNAPVSNIEVEYEASTRGGTDEGTFQSSDTATTTVRSGEEGQAEVVYVAPDDVGAPQNEGNVREVTVTARIDTAANGNPDFESVEFTIYVINTDGS